MSIPAQYNSFLFGNSITSQLIVNSPEEIINDWQATLVLDFPIRETDGDYEILGGEVVNFELTENGNYRYVVDPFDYNQIIEQGNARGIFFNGEYTFGIEIQPLRVEVQELNEEPSPNPLSIESSFLYWSGNNGATVYLTATNDSGEAITDPVISFESDFEIRELPSDIWNSEIVGKEEIENGYAYRIRLSGIALEPGQSSDFGFNTSDNDPQLIFNDSLPNPDPDPLPTNGGIERPSYNRSTGFFVLDGKIYDANGNEFIARGVNNMHVWFDTSSSQPATDALDNIADFGFNSVRIAWDTDFSGHGDFPHDWILEQAIDTAIDNSLVPMVELHDFTGSNDTNDLLNRGVKWWTDRSQIWQKYESSLMINIANEFGDYHFAFGESRQQFPTVYKEAITRIRNAGINNTLVIDPFHYGKEYDLISEYGREILEHDPQQNVVFSVHFYNGYGEDRNSIKDAFDSITGQDLPLVIGEFGTHHASGSVTSGNIQEEYIMELAEQYGVGTYPWAWHGDGHGHSLSNSWEATTVGELTPFGQSVIPHLEDSEIATIF